MCVHLTLLPMSESPLAKQIPDTHFMSGWAQQSLNLRLPLLTCPKELEMKPFGFFTNFGPPEN